MSDQTAGLSEQTIKNLDEMDFKCQRCSNCCRYDEGYVFLSKDDAEAIAAHLHLSLDDFMHQYCRLVDHSAGQVLCLKEKSNNDCIFWNDGCVIYPVRPVQCMTFPYWPYLVNDKSLREREKRRCNGLDKKGDHTLDYKIRMYKMEQNSEYFVVK